MKKNKLILLTILMVLVLYCGAVIFVTKPNSFAYDAIFGDNAIIPARSTQQTQTADSASVDTEAIIAELREDLTKQAETFAKEVAAQSSESVRKAIEESLPSMVDEAVKKAISDLNLSGQIEKQVTKEVLSQQEELAAIIYANYSKALAEAVTNRIMATVTSVEPVQIQIEEPVAVEVVEEEVPATATVISVEEYEAQRQEIREAEINSLLEKLGE